MSDAEYWQQACLFFKFFNFVYLCGWAIKGVENESPSNKFCVALVIFAVFLVVLKP